jgi:tetratricopeptide (TPR) repeat protein
MPLVSRLFTLLCACLVASAAARAEPPKADDNWTGKSVIGAKPEQKIAFFKLVDGKEVPLTLQTTYPIRVREDRDGRLRISDGQHEGWVAKKDFVLGSDAPAYFTERLRVSPKDRWLLVMRGISWHCSNDYDKAIRDYTEALALKPDDPWALHARGSSRMGKKEYAEAVKDYSEALRVSPKFASALRGRGGAYLELKEYDKAIADFTEAIRLDPEVARGFYQRGRAWVKKGQYDKAIRDFTEVTILDSGDADAFVARGIAWSWKGKDDRAVEDFTEALRLKPDDAAALTERAHARFRKRLYEPAIQDYTEAIRLEPENVNLLFYRGQSRRLSKQFEEALRDYDEVIRLDPKHAAAISHKAYILAACPDDKLRNGAKAVELATTACELTEWKNGWRLDALAAACAETGDFPAAIKYELDAMKDAKFKQAEGRNLTARLRLYQQNKPYRE